MAEPLSQRLRHFYILLLLIAHFQFNMAFCGNSNCPGYSY